MPPSDVHMTTKRHVCFSCQVDDSGLSPLGLNWDCYDQEFHVPSSAEQPPPPGRMVSHPCGPHGRGGSCYMVWHLPSCTLIVSSPQWFPLGNMASQGQDPVWLICSPHISWGPGTEWAPGAGDTGRSQLTLPWPGADSGVRGHQRLGPSEGSTEECAGTLASGLDASFCLPSAP